MRTNFAFLGSIALCLAASEAPAQSLNIDFGVLGDAPGAAYGAAGQAGYWNDIGVLTTARIPLRGLDGQLTAVVIYGIGGTQMLTHDHPLSTGDDDALVDDMLIGFNDPVDVCVWIQNLQDGYYEVTNYALTPNDDDLLSRVRVDFANEGPRFVGGAWTGAHAEGVSYTRHHIYVTDGEIAFHSGEWAAEVQSGLNGVQIRLLSPASAPLGDPESLGMRIDTVLPNPATASQTIRFSLAHAVGDLSLEIFDPAGRTVCRRRLGDREAGVHVWEWDGLDGAGRSVPPSAYFLRLSGGAETATRTLLRIR
jgi:hypothetical protein